MYFIKITKDNIIHGAQIIVVIFSLVQLLEGAIVAALVSVIIVYLIGALEYI